VSKAYFKILPALNLIIETFNGKFQLSEYERMKRDEFSDPLFNPNFHVLADIRKADFGFETNNAESKVFQVTEFLKSNKEKVGIRKCAFLTVNPDQVVSSIFYTEYIKTLPIQAAAFSTLDKALEFLEIKGKKELEKELDNL
jgi:hypothetical protein